jgi:hypothetical protein
MGNRLSHWRMHSILEPRMARMGADERALVIRVYSLSAVDPAAVEGEHGPQGDLEVNRGYEPQAAPQERRPPLTVLTAYSLAPVHG